MKEMKGPMEDLFPKANKVHEGRIDSPEPMIKYNII